MLSDIVWLMFVGCRLAILLVIPPFASGPEHVCRYFVSVSVFTVQPPCKVGRHTYGNQPEKPVYGDAPFTTRPTKDEILTRVTPFPPPPDVGSCPTTGVIGVAFGAGLGRLQGKYGFLHDNMMSCRLVLADGSVVEASETENRELFWGLRGAGHNFGVAVAATFRVHPQAHGGVHHSWDLEYELDQCEAVFATLNAVREAMPADLAIFVLWMRRSDGGRQHLLLVNLVWSGAVEAAAPWIARFEALGPVLHSGGASVAWPDLPWTTYKGYNHFLSQPKVWTAAPYKMMSAACVRRFNLATTHAFFETVKARNLEYMGQGTTFGAMFECLPHHRVRAVPDDATAFPWRSSSENFLCVSHQPLLFLPAGGREVETEGLKSNGKQHAHVSVQYVGDARSVGETPRRMEAALH